MGSPLEVAEDIVQYGNKDGIMNSLLKIVALLSHRFALAASHAVLFGECQYHKSSSFVFDGEIRQLLIEKKLHIWLGTTDTFRKFHDY